MTEYTAKKVILKDADNNYLIPYTEAELPAQTNNSGKFLSTDGTNPSWSKMPTSNNLFDFKWTDYAISDASWIRSDSFSWQDGSIYADAYNHLASDISGLSTTSETIGSYTVTFYRAADGHKICLSGQETTVNNIYNSTGIAWYYILDTTNKKFKLPRTKYGFNGYRNKVGNYISQGLPNPNLDILYRQDSTSSGVYSGTYGTDGYTGASYSNTSGTDEWMQSSSALGSAAPLAIVIKNSVYGANSIVQPPATQMYLYFYVGEFTQTATEQTAGINSETLNQKVDLSSLTTIYPVIKMYVSGTSGYNIWSNGYCEQWGRTSASGQTVSFLKTFANTNYCITGGLIPGTASATYEHLNIGSLSTTSFYYTAYDSYRLMWKASGYLASGQY